MKTKFVITLLFLFVTVFGFSQIFDKHGAGVTIIIHGWNPDDKQPAWMTSMANAIIERSGGSGQIATITVTGTKGSLTSTCSDWNFNLASAASGEIVVLVNWTSVANHLNSSITAQEVAASVAPKIYQSQNSQPALSELPIHLIGHSRGGGMVFEIARLLGLQGIEVEHVTALDPHPLTSEDPQPFEEANTIDTPIQLYENILFVDNYYQTIEQPTGQYLTGAYNRCWTSLPGGYHNETGYTYTIGYDNYDFSDHMNIILAYHGTVDQVKPTTNGEATMDDTERAWYNEFEYVGENTGFKYSRIVRGNRKSTDIPVVSGDAIIAGYHNNTLLGGSGTRQSITTWTSAVWPNVIVSSALRSSTELTSGSQTLSSGEVLQINYKYRSYANASATIFYVDIDRNPYNDNNVATIGSQNLSATGPTITQSTIDWTVNGLTHGTMYYVYSKINDGTRTRFRYLDHEFNISCLVNIPDAKFKAALVEMDALDKNGDGKIQCSEAAAYSRDVNVSGKDIFDMTGIEAFTGITHLDCNGNKISNLDVSSNTKLTYLDCNNNALTSLNVKNGNNTNFSFFDATNNPNLTCIQVDNTAYSTTNWTDKDATASYGTDCSPCVVNIPDANFKAALLAIPGLDANNDGKIQCTEAEAYDDVINVENKSIADLAGIEAFTNIVSLNCSHNQLTALDVSASTSLQYLYCSSNLLTTLNVSGLTSLIESYCDNNQLATLNVSTNTSLEKLYCNNNLLTGLNITGLTSLSYIDCSHNQLSGLNVAGFTSLSEIYCNNNQFSSLDFSTNTALENLYCHTNLLTTLNVSGLTSLLTFYCYSNHLTALNVSTNTALDDFRCDDNLLTSLTVSGATNIRILNCTNNQLSTINVVSNTIIENLYCSHNVLTGLDVSEVATLYSLDCNDNKLPSLDVSSNSSLEYLNCSNNSLTSLNVKNGNNTNTKAFNAKGNPDLTCIQVDDAAYSTTNWTNKDATASYDTDCSACAVNIPDEYFKAALIAISELNTNSDEEIQCTEAAAFTGEINVNDKGIEDLTGIEAFTKITHLDCGGNSLTTMNVSSNKKLSYLDCSGNIYLNALDVSSLTSLIGLYCGNNELKTLDVSKNTLLQNLHCSNNLLTALKVTGLTSLSTFDCSNNQLMVLDVSGQTSLTEIDCFENQLSDLDLSANTALTSLDCHNNSLTGLNVKNGNNTHFSTFNATGNPELACIQVDDATWSTAHWTNKDAGAGFRTSCIVIIPDANFKAVLVANTEINTNGDGEIQCTEAEAFNGEINATGKSIADLTGIEAFTKITLLNCSSNQLTALDVSSNTKLENLNCASNALTTLNISGLTSLSILDCSHNQLSTLTVAGFTSLSEIYCNDNLISSLNVAGLTSLLTFYCQTNRLASLDVSTNTALDDFRCDDNLLTSLNVSGAVNMTTLNCTNNQLSSLDVSNNFYIANFFCGHNLLTSLNVSEVVDIYQLDCNDNKLTSLDVSLNSSLTLLNCFNNSLTSLNVQNGNNIHMNAFNATGNPVLTCIEVDNAAWSTTNWTNKDATSSYNCATWTGDFDTDWNTADNWNSNVVPTANYGVIIPDKTNEPIVNEASATAAICNSMTIQSGAALTIAAGKALTINGNLNNQAGTTGLVIKSGDLTLGDIGTGSLKILGSVSGSAKVERYMAPDVWHLISSPTANQPIINFLNYNTDIAATPATAPYTYAMKNYKEDGSGWITEYFKDGKSTGDLFGTGKGYLVRTVGPTVSKIAYFEGALNTLPIGTSVPVISGWNLVGNPFTSAISINSGAGADNFIDANPATLTGSYAAIYVWDETKSTTEYQVVNNSGDATYAQVGQGFFVKAVAGNLNFTSSIQVHQGSAPFKAATAPTPQIKLIAGSSAGSASTIIKFIDGTTNGLDVGYDAGVFKADQPIALYTKLVEDNGVDFQLQCLPPTGYENLVIPIGIDSKVGGEIVFSVETVQLVQDCKVILEDKLTNTFTDLSKNSYKAAIVANTAGTGRFYLHTGDIISGVEDHVLPGKLTAYARGNTEIRLIGEVGEGAVATLFNGLGKVVLSKILDAGSLNIIGLPNNLSSGVYLLNIIDKGTPQTIKVMVRK